MRFRYFYAAIIITTLFAAVLVQRAARPIPPGTATPLDPPSDVWDGQVERVELQDNTSALTSATSETLASQATPIPDGLALLMTHCTRCHVTAWIDQFEKSNAEWEEVLARMGAMGIRLSETEKDAIIKYLAAAK
jgi:hypothetical protein